MKTSKSEYGLSEYGLQTGLQGLELHAYGDEELGRVSAIPIVMCPHCGGRMALSRIAPATSKPQGRMHYACSCGFGYPADIGFSHRL